MPLSEELIGSKSIEPPDGFSNYLWYAGEDLEKNDLCYFGVDGCIYRVRNAIETYPPKEHFMQLIRKYEMNVEGTIYEGITCGVCGKMFFVDTRTIPQRGCWTCPYCTGLTIDERVKNADVIKLKFDTFKRKMQDGLEDMQRQVDLLEGHEE